MSKEVVTIRDCTLHVQSTGGTNMNETRKKFEFIQAHNKQTGLIDQSHSPINAVKDKVYQCYEDECKTAGMTANEARILAYQLSLAFQIAAEVDE